jgi:hypothetical protein
MKKLIAATALMLSTTAAYADGLTFNAGAEYAIEAETFEITAGANYSVYDFGLFADVTFTKEPTGTMDYDETEIGVAYALKDNVEIYGLVRLDDSFDYEDTVIGVKVIF